MNYTVLEEYPLDIYLQNKFKDLSNNKLKSLLKNKLVLVNQKIVTNEKMLLKKGNVVTILKGDKSLPFSIIYEDKDIIVVNKPSGMLTMSSQKEKINTVYHYVSTYLKNKKKGSKVFIVHRLDQDTSGVLMFAKSQKVKELYQKNWNQLVLVREYVAKVEGHLNNKEGTVIQYLKENEQGIVFETNKSIGKKAITKYSLIKETNNSSYVKVLIETGKKHQIRLAFKSLGNQIVGDKKYGNSKSKEQFCLHASILSVKSLNKDYTFKFLAPLPNWYKID